MRSSLLAIALTLISLPLIPTSAAAQIGGRISIYGTAGMGGRVDASIDPPDVDVGDRDLSASFGGGARLELPVVGPLMLGAVIEHRRVEVTPFNQRLIDNAGRRQGVTDFDGWVGLNFTPIEGPVGLDLFLGGLIGPSLLTDDAYSASGFNVGVTGGLRVLIGPVGVFADVGYRRHQFNVRESPDYKTYWQQLVIDLGLSLAI